MGSVAAPRSAAAVVLQSPGWLRGGERRRTVEQVPSFQRIGSERIREPGATLTLRLQRLEDPVALPPIPLHRSALLVEGDRLQPGKPPCPRQSRPGWEKWRKRLPWGPSGVQFLLSGGHFGNPGWSVF